jgi:hypothetical protein
LSRRQTSIPETLRHHPVQHDQIGLFFGDQQHRLFAIVGHDDHGKPSASRL